ncbi:glutathione S-transferase [Sphingomonas sp.]|uniref:glutathione S-transferase n=1 Tax=Sphingomonas sp. TaxID=28214 RepID=UPI0028B1D88F|nr:glutathione S-transferase [Sphingomonas sp.]
MRAFDLYYWPVPFRGQFLRAILAFADARWAEHDADDIAALMDEAPAEQPIGFMGPPVLVDRERDFALSQMPAIALYLGERLNLLPDSPEGRALTAKVANDANDVIDELTLDGGRDMWTQEKWDAFVPRLQKWLQIFEDLGKRKGLSADAGFLLGTRAPGVADIITSTLWSTMADHFPKIADLAEHSAPAIWGLSRRLQQTPALVALKRKSAADFGEAYCGGDIETSLRKVAG